MRLEINYREKKVKTRNTWRLNNMLLNNQEITEEIKEEIKKYLETMRAWSQCSASGEATTMRSPCTAVRSSPRLPQLEKACKQQQRPNSAKNKVNRASLVAQWLRIRLPMQGTRVQALVWEGPACRGATRPVSHNY